MNNKGFGLIEVVLVAVITIGLLILCKPLLISIM